MTMDCHRVEELLSSYVNDELTEELSVALSEHLRDCSSCRLVEEELLALRSLCKQDSRPSLADTKAFDLLANIKSQVASEKEMASADNEILTMEEAAAFLRVSPRDLEEEFDTLPVFMIGNKLRVRRSQLLLWVEERERKTRGRRLFTLVNE